MPNIDMHLCYKHDYSWLNSRLKFTVGYLNEKITDRSFVLVTCLFATQAMALDEARHT